MFLFTSCLLYKSHSISLVCQYIYYSKVTMYGLVSVGVVGLFPVYLQLKKTHYPEGALIAACVVRPIAD
jgi:hypothetical protein